VAAVGAPLRRLGGLRVGCSSGSCPRPRPSALRSDVAVSSCGTHDAHLQWSTLDQISEPGARPRTTRCGKRHVGLARWSSAPRAKLRTLSASPDRPVRTITARVGVDPRGQAVGRTHAVEHVEPAAAVEAKVEQDERRLAGLDGPQRLGRARRASHTEPVGRQVLGQERASRLVVLHHQDQALFVHTEEKDRRGESRPRRPGPREPRRVPSAQCPPPPSRSTQVDAPCASPTRSA
jgi:hypothetical protein